MAVVTTAVCHAVPENFLNLILTPAIQGYHSIRDNLPQQLPDKPPFTAHLGNLSYDATAETVTEFFEDCNVVNVRIIEDREQQRPKGFAYAEFGDLEGLKTALTRDGQSFQGRTIRVKVADPRKSCRRFFPHVRSAC
jgi:translation initiation factor 4B